MSMSGIGAFDSNRTTFVFNDPWLQQARVLPPAFCGRQPILEKSANRKLVA